MFPSQASRSSLREKSAFIDIKKSIKVFFQNHKNRCKGAKNPPSHKFSGRRIECFFQCPMQEAGFMKIRLFFMGNLDTP